MGNLKEYELTLEAIQHAMGALSEHLRIRATAIWQREGCVGLARFADVTPLTDVLEAYDADMLATLRDLCIALNTLIEEDTSK